LNIKIFWHVTPRRLVNSYRHIAGSEYLSPEG